MTASQASVFESIRRLLCELLAQRGVAEVMMLDRDGEIVLQVSRRSIAADAAYATRLLRQATASRILAPVPEETARPRDVHLHDGSRSVWIAATGTGTSLVVFWDQGVAPGLYWRICAPCAQELQRLLNDLMTGSGTATLTDRIEEMDPELGSNEDGSADEPMEHPDSGPRRE